MVSRPVQYIYYTTCCMYVTLNGSIMGDTILLSTLESGENPPRDFPNLDAAAGGERRKPRTRSYIHVHVQNYYMSTLERKLQRRRTGSRPARCHQFLITLPPPSILSYLRPRTRTVCSIVYAHGGGGGTNACRNFYVALQAQQFANAGVEWGLRSGIFYEYICYIQK